MAKLDLSSPRLLVRLPIVVLGLILCVFKSTSSLTRSSKKIIPPRQEFILLEANKTIYTTEFRPEVILCARRSMPQKLEGVRVATEISDRRRESPDLGLLATAPAIQR